MEKVGLKMMKNEARDKLIKLLHTIEDHPEKTCPRKESDSCDGCEFNTTKGNGCDTIARRADYLIKNGVIAPPCKVGDKAAVRALCECVTTIPDYDECRNICPFEDDCECEECDDANERIFNTEISSIFNNGLGWKVTFKNLSCIEASFTDIGTSFFVGENAEQQAKEAEQKLKEMRKADE